MHIRVIIQVENRQKGVTIMATNFRSVPVQAVCNTILKKSFTEKITVTPMKLQKLLYFIYRDFLQKYDCDLFSENFEVWTYGPVLSSVYDEFKSFKASRITKFAKNADGSASIIAEDGNAKEIIEIIDSVWERYKTYTGIELSNLTHRPDSAGYKAHRKGDSILNKTDIRDDHVG